MRDRNSISFRFQIRLAIIVAVTLTLSTLFIFILNTKINNRNYADIISITLEDVERDIEDESDVNILNQTYRAQETVEEVLKKYPSDDVQAINKELRKIVKDEGLSEMSVVNKDNKLIYASKDEYIGFDMDSTKVTKEFDALNHGKKEVVQPVRENAYKGEGDYDKYNKYAGVPLKGVGYLQVAISSRQFQQQIDENVNYLAVNRHIGRTGFVIISDYNGKIVSYAGENADEYEKKTLKDIGITSDMKKNLGKSFVCEVNGEKQLTGVSFVEGYYIIGTVPMSEVQSFRNRAALYNVITEIIIFILMFMFISGMINTLIVRKIHNVNDGLGKIIDGELDTEIEEYSTTEFIKLSTDINSTVNSLKNYMKREQEKILQELEFAKNIQLSALPKLSTIDNNKYFDLYATMDTAKEVGGDFYDFYMVSENRLAFLIADVSGKGVPAAMFMMTSKTMLKDLVESGLSLSEAFTKANELLCETNDAGMFVTVWMGILDLTTGHVEYVNAGHNAPLCTNESGKFEYLKCKPGFVLTGMDGMVYKSQEITLNPGDRIFLYTDGVTEANDPKEELYGEERLLEYMNDKKGKSPEVILHGLKKDIDKFADGAPQFDDITMLSLTYKG